MKYVVSIFFLSSLFISCTQEPTSEEILEKVIQAHGGDQVYNANVSFDFRDKHYKAQYNHGQYKLARYFSDSLDNKYIDVLTNEEFERKINDSIVQVTDEWVGKYSNSINSVFYFFRLPFNLKDDAVILTYLGKGEIEETSYYKLKVTFGEEGGGEDFDDIFVYWFNSETYKLDYLAYEYATEGGGKRFRKAFNQRMENGWLMSDFINYKPNDLKVDIADYDTYFEEGGFVKLSEIVNKNIEVSFN
ncbi:MAG: hypothetical protein L3J29_06385 [Cyclobacteriaceae bacterium]|nr:hypothetical protein [Cyclobacteriaceae bacterium]